MKNLVLCCFLGTLVPLFGQDAAIIHYWDMDTLDEATESTPIDVSGAVPTSAGANLRLEMDAYGSAPSGGNYLRTERTRPGVPLVATVFTGETPALDFGTESFSFSYWTYDDSTDDNGGADIRGPRIFDCLRETTNGLQLGTQLQGIFNFRIDDETGGSLISNLQAPPFPTLRPPQDQWVHVAVTVDRTPGGNAVEIFFDGASQGSYPLAGLSGPISPSQDLQIGCINGGANASGIQTGGLDDLAFYTGLLSSEQISDLADGGQPLVVAPPPPPPAPAPIGHYWDFDTGEGFLPVDLQGNLPLAEIGFVTIDNSFGEAYPGAGNSLNSSALFPDFLSIDTFGSEQPTALDFGQLSFALSFWSYLDGSAGTARGSIFDCRGEAGSGLQLGTTESGVFDLWIEDEGGNRIVTSTSAGYENLRQTADQWIHVTLNIDRRENLLTIYIDGDPVPGSPIDLSTLTGSIFCTQDLQLGARDSSTENSALDDFAIYPGVLARQQIQDLAAAAVTPLEVLASFLPPTPIPVTSLAFDSTRGEITVSFLTNEGALYSVYGGEDLETLDSWEELSPGDIEGDGAEVTFSIPAPPSAREFFFQIRRD